jgi:hypothetical protein
MSTRRPSTDAEPWNNAYARAKAGIRPATSIYDYPDHPGAREQGGASEVAAIKIAGKAATLRTRCIAAFNRLGPSTADEIAVAIEETAFAVRPRITELYRAGTIEKTDARRLNESGLAATVWRIAPRETEA